MKLSYKVMSTAALTALVSTALISTPAIYAEDNKQESVRAESVIISADGKQIVVSLAEYGRAFLGENPQLLDYLKDGKEFPNVSNVVVGGKYITLSSYGEAILNYGEITEEILEDIPESINDEFYSVSFDENGAPILTKIDKPFEVINISSINETGVTVQFPSSEQDRESVTVKVVNPAGKEEAVKAQNIEAGKEEATFEFETALEDVATGTWTVNGKTFEVPGEGTIEVASVNAINETSVGLQLPENFEGDLKDKSIKLTAGETELTATYVSSTNGVASFKLDVEAKLVDATTYVTTADWATITNGEFVAKVAAEYVASFEAVTTAITAAGTDENAPTQNSAITFKAVNQYGEEIAFEKVEDLEVAVTLNDVLPLEKDAANKAGFKVDESKGLVTIERNLAKDDTVKIELTNSKTVDGKEQKLATATFDYTVVGAAAQVATSITLNAAKTSLPAKEGTELKVAVLDQFNNTKEETVTFVVNGKVVTPTTTSDIIQKDANGKYTFKTNTPGEYKIVATVANNTKIKAEATITVGAATLTSLTVEEPAKVVTESAKRLNKEEITIATVAPSEGAALVAENIKFNVTSTTAGVTAADLSVKAEKVTVGTGADAKEVIVIKATTDKKGTYTVTPYVGESLTAEGVATGAPVTFTTATNTTVDSISDITFEAKELKIGSKVKKEIVFKNKHGEVLTAAEVEAQVTSSKTGVVASSSDKSTTKVVDGTEEADKGKVFLEFVPADAGTTQLTVQTGDKLKSYTLTVVTPEVKTVNAGADITGVVAADDAAFAKYNDIKFLDQDGVEVADEGKVTVTVKDSTGKEVTNSGDTQLVTLLDGYTVNKETGVITAGNAIATDDASKTVKAIQINPKAKLKGPYTVEVSYLAATEGAKAITDTFTVEVGEARKADKITVAPKSVTAGIGGSTEVIFESKDQYGAFKALTKADLSITSSDENIASGTVVENNDKTALVMVDAKGKATTDVKAAVGYKVAISTPKSGTATITIAYKESVDKVSTTVKDIVSVQVAPASTLVKSLEITGTNVDAEGNYKHQVKDAGGTAKLDVKAKDANGNVVTLKSSDIVWTSSNPAVATVSDGVVTTAKDIKEGKTEEVTITAEVFGVEKSITLVIGDAEVAQIQAGTVKVKATTEGLAKLDGNADKAGIQIYLDGKASDSEKDNGTIDLTFEGANQFGEKVAIPKANQVSALSYNEEAINVSINELVDAGVTYASSITITPKAVTTEDGVVVQYKVGNQTIKVDVIVTGDNAEIKRLAAEANAEAKVTVATEAVDKAEKSNKQADIDSAKALVDELPADSGTVTTKDDLQKRIVAVEAKLTDQKALDSITVTKVASSAVGHFKDSKDVDTSKEAATNQDSLTIAGNVEEGFIITANKPLTPYGSSVADQSTGNWVGVLIDTNFDTIVGSKYGEGYTLSVVDEKEAQSVGGEEGTIVLWIKADDATSTTKEITLTSKNGATKTIQFTVVNPSVSQD